MRSILTTVHRALVEIDLVCVYTQTMTPACQPCSRGEWPRTWDCVQNLSRHRLGFGALAVSSEDGGTQ